MYGNVSNRMEVSRRNRSFHVAVAVPTPLFTLMREVLKVPLDLTASLSLDLSDSFYLLSLSVGRGGDISNLYDLWAYTEKALPSWVENRDYHI